MTSWTGPLRHFLHVQPSQGAHRVALRAGVSVAVPLLTVLAVDRPEWSLYAVFGAITSLYGRNHVHLSRATMQASAGLALTASVAFGALAGSADERAWLAVAGGAVVAVLGGMLSAAQDWHPPGPLFLIFGFGAVASVPHEPSQIPVAAGITVASAAFSLLIGNVGALVRRRRTAPARLAPVLTWEPAMYAVAVGGSGAIATGIGIGHPYWAMVAAVAPLTVRGRSHQLIRAGHRVVGTFGGLVVAAGLLALDPTPVAVVLMVVVCQIGAELLIGRNYALALLLITPLALLMGQLAVPRDPAVLVFDRGVETLVGATVAVLTVLLWSRLIHDGRVRDVPADEGQPP